MMHGSDTLYGEKRFGVSFVLINPDGKILVVQETFGTPFKKPGDFSIPMETKKENETDEEAIKRGIAEEANGILEYEINKEPIKKFTLVGVAEVNCFLVNVKSHKDCLTGDDVKNHQWLDPEEFLKLESRLGAKQMVEEFIRITKA